MKEMMGDMGEEPVPKTDKININTIVSDIKYKLHQTNYVDSTKSTPVVISFTNNIDTGHIVTPYYPFIPD